MQKLIAALIGLLLVFGLAVAQDTESTDAEGGNVVEIEMVTEGSDFYFDPVGVQVEPGTTIRFVNVSGQHSSTAYSEENGKPQRIPEEAESWDSGVLVEEGAVFEVTLDVEGVYDYYCIPHEALGMVGRIVVGDPSAAPAQPLDQFENETVRNAFPSVEQIVEQGVVNFGEASQ